METPHLYLQSLETQTGEMFGHALSCLTACQRFDVLFWRVQSLPVPCSSFLQMSAKYSSNLLNDAQRLFLLFVFTLLPAQSRRTNKPKELLVKSEISVLETSKFNK